MKPLGVFLCLVIGGCTYITVQDVDAVITLDAPVDIDVPVEPGQVSEAIGGAEQVLRCY